MKSTVPRSFRSLTPTAPDHPDAVLSLDPPAPEPEKPLPSEKKKKPPKAERPAFYLTAEDARSFNYQDSYTGAELKAALIEAAGDPDVKAPTIKEIDEWLLAQRLIGMERLPTKGFYYVPTPAGVDAGLRSEDKVSARGTPYSVLLFTPEAQPDGGGALYKTGLTTNRQVPAFAHGHGGMWACRPTFHFPRYT